MCVPVGTQASYMTTNGNDVSPGAIGRGNGAYFNTYFSTAQQTRPKFTFIHSWNEWHALNLGTQSTPTFVDQWLTEYSSDIEPMAGGHGYQYYDLMVEQVGRLQGTFPIQHGQKYLLTAAHSNKALDNAGWSTANGNQMNQWDTNGAAVQQWTAYDLGGGYWRFVNVHSGKSLEVGGYSTANGGKVQQWDWLGHNWQQWSLRPVGNGRWKVVNRGSGLLLDVSGGPGAAQSGALVHQWADANGTNQHWNFQLVP